MVNHGRDKKEAKPQQQRRGKKNQKGGNDDDPDDAAATMRDMELPDDYSIFGGSASSNAGFDDADADADGDLFDDEGGGGDDPDGGEDGDPDRVKNAVASRASKLADALSLASTISSVSF
jgi:hypothetical protein